MSVEFECRKCGKIVSLEQYESDRFCPHYDTFLRVKKVRIDSVRKGMHATKEPSLQHGKHDFESDIEAHNLSSHRHTNPN